MKNTNKETDLAKKALYNSSFWKQTKRNKELIDDGFPTIIPFTTFPNLAKYIPGIVPSDYVLMTANTGVGKSRVSRKLFIKNIIDFAKNSNIKIKIFLNSLEENEAKVEQTFVAEYLHLKHGWKADYYTLSNFSLTSLSEKQMAQVAEAVIWVQQNIFSVLEVISEPNSYVAYKKVRNYLKEVGKFYTVDKDETGNIISKVEYDPKGKRAWNFFEYNEPTMVISIFDTYDASIGYKVSGGESYTKYEAIRRYSEQLLRGLLCKVCGVIGVAVMQQREDLTVFVWLCYD